MHVWAFTAVAIVLIVTPGPDMALVTRNALRSGRRAALATSFGVCTGLLVWTAASALGVAALVHASALALLGAEARGRGLPDYAVAAARASGILQRPRVRRALDRLTGFVLIGLGVRLATERR
jgi:threonine/homoserine/homoserine lactone efflux protein